MTEPTTGPAQRLADHGPADPATSAGAIVEALQETDTDSEALRRLSDRAAALLAEAGLPAS